jgi:hypothetical protein
MHLVQLAQPIQRNQIPAHRAFAGAQKLGQLRNGYGPFFL